MMMMMTKRRRILDACVKSSCSLNEVPEPSVARPLMLFLVMTTMVMIAMMAVVVDMMMLITMMMTRGLRRMSVA